VGATLGRKKKEIAMLDKRVALITGANQGVGLQVAKELVANGLSVLVGSRDFARGDAAAKKIGSGAIALQLERRTLPFGLAWLSSMRVLEQM
jgi:NAD(P)-dependent dehydrogenase (short-subunit alcohol dehydrogenase family)